MELDRIPCSRSDHRRTQRIRGRECTYAAAGAAWARSRVIAGLAAYLACTLRANILPTTRGSRMQELRRNEMARLRREADEDPGPNIGHVGFGIGPAGSGSASSTAAREPAGTTVKATETAGLELAPTRAHQAEGALDSVSSRLPKLKRKLSHSD